MAEFLGYEDRHLRTHCSENLKSYFWVMFKHSKTFIISRVLPHLLPEFMLWAQKWKVKNPRFPVVYGLRLNVAFRRFQVQISARRPAILTEVFRVFP
jgi:hypothetical protein